MPSTLDHAEIARIAMLAVFHEDEGHARWYVGRRVLKHRARDAVDFAAALEEACAFAVYDWVRL